MLNFFGFCSGTSKNNRIKPGEVGIHAYQAKTVKKRDMMAVALQNLNSSPEDKSFKNEVQNDETTKPIEAFKLDPFKLTQSTGDPSTFLRTVEKSKFQELSESLKNKKQKFTDPDFPPTNTSLGNDPRFEKTVKTWIRLGELYKNPAFFSNDVEPKDILQGYIQGAGNCYLLSAIANLAKNPDRIKQIFGNKQVTNEGIYFVNLFNKGAFKQIIIDDFVPVSGTSFPVFARPPPDSGQIWVQLLQKSYAKLFGSYKSMNGGLPSEAYYALTGAPTFFYSLIDSKALSQKYWTVVKDAHEKNYCVDFGTPLKVDSTKWIKPNHAYTMLGAYEIQGHKLVKLRNPMGAFQWTGRASDYDMQFWKSIQPENKKIIGYEPGEFNDGTFFMLWEDISTYFILFEVCQYKDNANVLSIRKEFTIKNANMFEIQTEGGQVVVSLSQDSQRGTEIDLATFKYSKSYIIIARVLKNAKGDLSYKIVRMAARNQFAAHHQRVNLEPGKYFVYAKYRWNDNVNKNGSFVVYTDSPVRIRQAKQTEYPQFFQQIYLSIVGQVPQFIEPTDKYTYIKKFYGQSGGFGFYAVKVQKDIPQKIQVQIDENLMKESHLTLKKPYKNKGKSKITLKAGQYVIIPFRNKDVIIPQNLKVPDLSITIKP